MKKAIFLLIILALASCGREPLNEVENKKPVVIPPTDLVLGSISGVITDEDGLPLSDVEVATSGDDIAVTGENGEFVFMDIELYADGTYLTAKKAGYFNGSRKFNAKADQVNNVKIQLLTKVIIKGISTQNGGTVSMSNARIEFPSGDYLRQDLSSYNGNINISGKYLNPSLESTHLEMPGELIGFDQTNELKVLASFGLLNLEMESDDQDMLELPTGQPITIFLDIAKELVDYAPNIVALSHFYKNSGSWVQEATAERIGDQYVATVNKGGFWNFNVPLALSEVSGNIFVNENLSSNTKVKITALSSGYQAYAETTDQGYYSCYLPKDLTLEMTVFEQCANFPLPQTIDPLQSSLEKLDLEYAFEANGNATIEGKIENCNNTTSQNNYLRVDIGSDIYMIKASENGQYKGTLPLNICKANGITVYGMDLENRYTTPAIHHTLSEHLELETLTPCNMVPAGFDIDYMHMNWKDELATSVRHSWRVNTISGGADKRFMITPSIINEESKEVYMTGVFVFYEGTNTATYTLEYKSQGFNVSGSCNVEKHEHDGYNSYRFTDTSSDLSIIDDTAFPGALTNDVGAVTFDLVYYD